MVAMQRAVSRRHVLTALAVAAVVALGLVYLLGVRTTWGQRLDATALRGRDVLRPRTVAAAGTLLGTIDVASLVFVGGAIVFVALARRRPLLALGAGCVIAGSIITTELLKRLFLPRPFLGIIDPLGRVASFPSGHTTVAFSLAIGALLAAPQRFRALVAVMGALYTTGIGVGVVATAHHRPSDPIGAVLVVTAWGAAIAAVLLGVSVDAPPDVRDRGVSPTLALGGVGLLIIAFVGLLGTAVAIKIDRLGTVELSGAFYGACAAVTGAVLVAIAALLAALRGVSLDPPPPEDGSDELGYAPPVAAEERP